jgi:hypothetical protein
MKSLMESKNVGEDAVKEEERINIHKMYTDMYNEKNSSICPVIAWKSPPKKENPSSFNSFQELIPSYSHIT